jgi:hypothetical protein
LVFGETRIVPVRQEALVSAFFAHGGLELLKEQAVEGEEVAVAVDDVGLVDVDICQVVEAVYDAGNKSLGVAGGLIGEAVNGADVV